MKLHTLKARAERAAGTTAIFILRVVVAFTAALFIFVIVFRETKGRG